jgi:hypothetical protein
VYGLAIKPLWTIHIILLLYKDGQKNIGENSDMPSLTVTSSALELRSDYQNLVEKAEKSVSESRSNLTDR